MLFCKDVKYNGGKFSYFHLKNTHKHRFFNTGQSSTERRLLIRIIICSVTECLFCARHFKIYHFEFLECPCKISFSSYTHLYNCLQGLRSISKQIKKLANGSSPSSRCFRLLYSYSLTIGEAIFLQRQEEVRSQKKSSQNKNDNRSYHLLMCQMCGQVPQVPLNSLASLTAQKEFIHLRFFK